MKKIIMLILIIPIIAHAAELSEILGLEIPPISFFIKSAEKTLTKNTHAKQGASLIPSFSFGNTFDYFNSSGDFENYNYTQKLTNKLGITFTINPGTLYLLHNQKKTDITTLKSEIFALYGDIMMIISESKRLIDDLQFKLEYRRALTDYKLQIAQDEIIFKQKSVIITNYHESLRLLLELYAKCGIDVNYENAEYNYQYETIEKIFLK